MAGLQPLPLPSLTLRFEFGPDTPWAGHTILCRRQVSLEAALSLNALVTGDEEQVLAACRRFADLFIEDWTFSEPGPDGTLVKLPITGDTFVRVLDARMAMELFQQWVGQVGTGAVPAPLGSASGAGGQPPPQPVAPAAPAAPEPEPVEQRAALVVIPGRKGP